MELADSKQTRIFAPFAAQFSNDGWREEILGDIVKPLIKEFSDQINWFWFSQYVIVPGGPIDIDDTDFERIKRYPDCLNADGIHRSIRFRINPKANFWEPIKKKANELISQTGAVITDWRDYSVVGDLGSDRFAPPNYSDDQRRERAYLIVTLYEAISQVTLAMLVKKEGRWCPEYDINSYPNIADSLHHVFCNISDTRPVTPTLGGKFQRIRF